MEENIIEKKEPPVVLRWTVLLLISLAMFGNYYVYDCISPLADLLKTQLGFSDSNIGMLNAIYSLPNILMVFIGGLIIDKIGTRKSVLIFTLLVGIGAVIPALEGNFYVMVVGRLIFGLGAESMIVAITTIVAKWFKGKELSFAFGLNLTVARLGSFLALNSPTWGKGLYDSGWQGPLYVSVAAGIFSIFCIVIYFAADAYASKHYNTSKDGSSENIDFKQIFSFNRSFWIISLLCVTFYSAMFPFQTFAIKFFQEAHGTTREVGGNLSSILTLAAMIFTPLFGLLSDKIGKRSYLMMFGSLLIVPVYLIMAYKIDLASPIGLTGGLSVDLAFFGIEKTIIPYYLIIPMAMMGIAFSLIPAVMWPSVALIVNEEKLGTAYGLMTMIQNIGLSGFNILIGWANDYSMAGPDNPGGYALGMWIFSTLGFSGLVLAILLKNSDKYHGKGLLDTSVKK